MLKAIAEVAKVILVKRDNVIEETMKNTELFGDIVVLRIHDLRIGFENATLRFLTTEELSDNSNRRQGCRLSSSNPIHISYKDLNVHIQ